MRNAIVRLAALLFAFGAASTQAAAQQPPQARRPPPEVSVGMTKFFPIYGDSSTDDLDEGGTDLRSYNEIDEPLAIAVGVGFQERLASYVAVRTDAQLVMFLYLPLGYRFSTSVSIPFGHYSTN